MTSPQTRPALFAVSLLTTFLCVAATGAEQWFKIGQNPAFADVEAQLQIVVDEHAHQSVNRFCVVGKAGPGFTEAWVHWPAENKLILWLPVQGDPQSILDSKRYLDLTRDIIKDEATNSSTYKISRSFANETIRECRRHGTNFLIQKSKSVPPHG